MIVLNTELFDEVIAGTATTWYTSDSFNKQLGDPDWLVVFATARDVSGSSPAVKVFLQRSGDNQHWYYDALAPLISVSLTEGVVSTGQASGPAQQFRRLSVTLTGTNPKCRLKLRVTGRQA